MYVYVCIMFVLMCRFVDSEGWHLLNVWLAEYKKTQNIAVILEMIEVLQKLPVTVDALKKVSLGLIVTQMCPGVHFHTHFY